MPKTRVCLCFHVALFLAMASGAHAQVFDSVGVRAQGMSAFVAVADDATAAWWNPAGLATGKIFSLAIEHGSIDDPSSPGNVGPGRRDELTSGFSVAFPSLALSYYRFRVSEIIPDSAGAVRLQSLAVSQYGMTVGQSIGNHLVVGTTVTFLKAGLAAPISSAGGDPDELFDQAADLEVDDETKTDLDLGVMAAYSGFRAGLTVKHLRAPKFGEEGRAEGIAFERQARAGVSYTKTTPGLIAAMTIAADMDILRTPGMTGGDVRRFASGVELWLMHRRLGVRSGLSLNTVGEKNPTGSAGVTLGGTSTFFFDSAVYYGGDSARKGLSLGMSMTF